MCTYSSMDRKSATIPHASIWLAAHSVPSEFMCIFFPQGHSNFHFPARLPSRTLTWLTFHRPQLSIPSHFQMHGFLALSLFVSYFMCRRLDASVTEYNIRILLGPSVPFHHGLNLLIDVHSQLLFGSRNRIPFCSTYGRNEWRGRVLE